MNCKRIDSNNHPDVIIISSEEDGGEIKQERIQNLHEEITYFITNG
ncbi:hypothetical protein [Bacillus bingmayongensis]|nr:hypothetical protein [Bacillus bingmayongensis]MBY0599327.1 hypothetical protein [Bacillus bingmayongensis]